MYRVFNAFIFFSYEFTTVNLSQSLFSRLFLVLGMQLVGFGSGPSLENLSLVVLNLSPLLPILSLNPTISLPIICKTIINTQIIIRNPAHTTFGVPRPRCGMLAVTLARPSRCSFVLLVHYPPWALMPQITNLMLIMTIPPK